MVQTKTLFDPDSTSADAGNRYSSRVEALVRELAAEMVQLEATVADEDGDATLLDISTWTVSTHLRRVFAKLAVTSLAAMVARTIEDGLIANLRQPTGSSQPTAGARDL